MPTAQLFVDFSLEWATTILSALLVALFAVRGLYRLYPVFFCYWVCDALITVIVRSPVHLKTISRIQGAWLLIQWVLYFLLVLELVDRILEDHPGLARIGRRAVQIAMLAAGAAAIYSVRFDQSPQSPINYKAGLLIELERVVTACLLLFILTIILFLWHFPVRLSRNTKAYLWGFSLFFLVNTLAPYLLHSRGGAFFGTADTIHMGGVFLCQVIWLFAITKQGAEHTPAFSRSWSAADQSNILSTLDSFEQQISRTRGR